MKIVKKRRHVFERRSPGERVLFIIVFIMLFLYMLSLAIPVCWMLYCSLKTNFQYFDDIMNSIPFALPKWPLQFKNYVDAFTGLTYIDSTFVTMLFNTIWITVISTGVGLIIGAMFAYVLSRFNNKFCALVYAIVIFRITIPIGGGGSAGMILIIDWGLYDNPLYAIVTSFSGLGLPFFMFYGAFKNLSTEYSEAVYLDGGGEFTLFFKVMFPFVLPVFASLAIICSIGSWNNYQFPMMFLPSYPTLASGLFLGRQDFLRSDGGEPVYYAAIVLASLPMVIMFICFSDIIAANFTVGGLKG